jgi:hypothetical protein
MIKTSSAQRKKRLSACSNDGHLHITIALFLSGSIAAIFLKRTDHFSLESSEK